VVALAELIDMADPDSPKANNLWSQFRLAYQTLIDTRPESGRSLWVIIGPEKMRRLESG
jgi:hypothetical protein